ncbi:hypothetical protein GRI40_02870 [Altererythrobacter aerius]|uniref:Uncharacterized protein n=1 Tax=Tsuneonella aeria TaxID=1837929 RepID=A0A6I4TBN2_9SPHN|nr:hypothetical protein [Tsuneonella aeria]MXO74164.1 hypothetical protein [Tsuneonella aeria]
MNWPSVGPDGERRDELALAFDRRRARRLLVLPAWFQEANKMRRQTVEVMRRLDVSGIDSFLPDLPGCNESESPLAEQTLTGWRHAADVARSYFRATHVLAIRAGTLVAPREMPGWHYAPLAGARMLRSLVRAQAIADAEGGRGRPGPALLEEARTHGAVLAGWHLGSAIFNAIESATPTEGLVEIEQSALPGSALWLRAEPSEAPEQAEAIAAIIADGIGPA